MNPKNVKPADVYALGSTFLTQYRIDKKSSGDLSNLIQNYQKNLWPLLFNKSLELYKQNNYKEAITLLELLLEITNELNNREHEGSVLQAIGVSYDKLDQFEKALEYLEKSLSIKTDFDNLEDIGIVYNQIGNVYYSIENYFKAIEFFQKSLEIKQLKENRSSESIDLLNIGKSYNKLNQYKKALVPLIESLEINRKFIKNKSLEGVSLFEIGIAHSIIENPKESIFYLKQALTIFKELNEEEDIPDILFFIGINLFELNKFDEATSFFKELLIIGKKTEIESYKVEVLFNLGSIAFFKRNYNQSNNYLKQALSIYKSLDAKESIAATQYLLGKTHLFWGKNYAALDYFEKSYQYYSKDSRSVDILVSIAIIHIESGDYSLAMDKLNQASNSYNKFGENKRSLANIKYHLSTIYSLLGEYQLAFDSVNEAQTFYKSLDNQFDLINVYISQAVCYQDWGEYDRALEFYNKALKISEEIGSFNLRRIILNNLGTLYLSQELYSRALYSYKESFRLLRRIKEYQEADISYNNIGKVYSALGKYKKAIRFLKKSLRLCKRYGKKDTTTTIANIGDVYFRQNKYDKAINYYQEAFVICKELKKRDKEADILNRIGIAQTFLKRYNKALTSLKHALDVKEVVIGKTKSEYLRKTFRKTQLHSYLAIVTTLLKWYDEELIEKPDNLLYESLRFLEFFKAREILDKLELGKKRIDLSIVCPNYKKLIQKEQQLMLKMDEKSLVQQREKTAFTTLHKKEADSNNYKGAYTVTDQEITEIEEELVSLRQQILENCPDSGLVRLTTNFDPIASTDKIFEAEPNAIIWEFFFDESKGDYFYIFTMTKDKMMLYKSNQINLSEAIKLLKRIHIRLRNKDSRRANDYLIQLSDILSKWIPVDLWKSLNGKKLLILIPHLQLHLMPWSIIKNPLTTDNFTLDNGEHYLGLSIPIVRSFSLSLVTSCIKREKKMKEKFLFVANPNFNIENLNLTGAEKEVNSIEKLLSKISFPHNQYKILKNTNSSESKFKKSLKDGPSVIHFAGHGFFDSKDPWKSYLSFYSPEYAEYYTVTELVLDRFVGSPLFVLSACETARGEFDQEDDAIGLMRGFTLAGATSIVSTHWSLIDSVAKYYMAIFYQYLFEQKTVAEALYFTRKKLYNELLLKEPIFWAVYELYGNPFKTINE